MSLSERVSGTGEGVQKIAIWHLLNDLWLLQDGDIQFSDLVERHGLSQDEANELGSIITQRTAQGNTRLDDWRMIWQCLVAVERGVLTWQQAKGKLGVS